MVEREKGWGIVARGIAKNKHSLVCLDNGHAAPIL